MQIERGVPTPGAPRLGTQLGLRAFALNRSSGGVRSEGLNRSLVLITGPPTLLLRWGGQVRKETSRDNCKDLPDLQEVRGGTFSFFFFFFFQLFSPQRAQPRSHAWLPRPLQDVWRCLRVPPPEIGLRLFPFSGGFSAWKPAEHLRCLATGAAPQLPSLLAAGPRGTSPTRRCCSPRTPPCRSFADHQVHARTSTPALLSSRRRWSYEPVLPHSVPHGEGKSAGNREVW